SRLRCRRIARVGLLAAAALAIAGCAAQRTPSSAIQVAPDEAAKTLAERDHLLDSLETGAIMEYSGPAGHLKAREQLTVRRPASLRVEAMSPLGVALVVTADRDQIAVFDPSKNTLTRGAATADTLDRFARIPMPPQQAVQLLLGLAPDSGLLTGPPSATHSEGDMQVLSYTGHDGAIYDLGFTGGQLALVRESQSTGQVAYEVRYSDYRDIGAVKLPFQLEAHFFASATTISLRYSSPLIDRQIPDSIFVLSPGPGTRLIDLGFAGAPLAPHLWG
ncbi:MAG TPA: DUF4292 domain-containing protein, partial [Candidatus Binataceae bacterium]|nr:DUF4292 domain-containing protein [Candidatus Binataceae bacterium]